METTFSRPSISAEAAAALVERARASAGERGVAVSVAVVDDALVLKAFLRMDGAGHTSGEAARLKAESAAATGVPGSNWHGIAEGNAELAFGLSSLPKLTPLPGGYPLRVGGQLVGGLGVSGGTFADDEAIGEAAAAVLAGQEGFR